MKNFLLLILLLNTSWAFGQSIGSYNISTIGQSGMNESGGLYFAVGEPINSVIGNDELVIAQGFLQVAIESGTSQTNELLLSTLKVYPNPTSYELNLELLENKGSYRASLYNSIGQKIANTIFENEHQKIDLSSLAPGNYFLHVYDNEKSIGTYTIIKQ